MPESYSNLRGLLSRDVIDAFIRIGLIVLLAVLCWRLISPFLSLLLWGLLLAVGLYPLQRLIAARLGGSQGRAATVIVVVGLLVAGVPTLMLGTSVADHAHKLYDSIENQSLVVKRPSPSVAEWPVVGKRVYNAWNDAAEDLPGYVQENSVQLKALSRKALNVAANTAGSLLLLLASLIVAGIIMAYGESGSGVVRRILVRVTSPDKGGRLQALCTATVRSVAVGVIGVAFIQALLLGVGFMFSGIPVPGVLALIVMVLGIAQIPAAIIFVPAMIYMWSSGDGSTTANLVWSIYLVLAGLADNVLKPLLLGRGVEAPMPVVLIGALGGMATSGLIGLFLGAVILAVGYQLFMDWLDHADSDLQDPGEGASASQVDSAAG